MIFPKSENTIATKRYSLVARNGVVATSNALASAAGLQMLRLGGNAVDAAIATAACLTVVEPTANGIGGDNFALVWMNQELHGLNSNGYSPCAISLEDIKQKHEIMPTYGWTPVTVPGAPKGWVELNKRFGKLSLLECLTPAIQYARDGFPLSIHTAKMYQRAYDKLSKTFVDDPVFDEWKNTFLVNGQVPQAGDIITLKNHAKTLELIGKTNGYAFYKGELADIMEAESKKFGGYLRKKDLMEFEAEWVTPLSVQYRDIEVVELPPAGQGIVGLMALNILNNYKVKEKNSEYFHHCFEAMKMSFADAFNYVTDPKYMKLNPKELITPEYGQYRFNQIQEQALEPQVSDPSHSGTVYLTTADHEGNMVSMIQSNYMGFGSGVVVKGTGIALQNRGADFKLDKHHVNCLAPHKRTYHTIIPGMLKKDNQVVGTFGVMGGYMQPQGHLQVVSNLVDFKMDPQMALDDTRWQWIKDKEFKIEDSMDPKVIEELRQKGHNIEVIDDYTQFGRGQIILRDENGTYVVGTESRTDGNIALY